MIKKCLKRLCTFLLIGLPILFVNFSSAYTYPNGSVWTNPFNHSLGLGVYENAELVSRIGSDKKDMFVFNSRSNYNAWFFWDASNLPYFVYYNGISPNPSYIQGEFTYYYVCDYIPNTGSSAPGNCILHDNLEDGAMEPIFSQIDDEDLFYFNGAGLTVNDYGWSHQEGVQICFSSRKAGLSVCFASCVAPPDWISDCNRSRPVSLCRACNDLDDLDGLYEVPYTGSFLNVPTFFLGHAPGFVNWLDPIYEIEDGWFTNREIINGYEYLGLDVGYCYGGFDIDNIFEPNETIEDFTGYKFGYGATVFDLYNLYSGAYSTPKIFFSQMAQAYSNGQINRFKTEPKALIMFVQQFMSAKSRGRVDVGFYDLWDYCNLKFYGNPDNIYTGHNETGKRGARDYKTNNQNNGGFQFSGNNALNKIVGSGGTGFSNPAKFFGDITSIFQNGLGILDTSYVGIIPTYILMFMFALIFIRIIKH